MKAWKSVDEYIAAAPKQLQPKLREVRAAIKEVAPDAVESISYGMPFYSFKGESGLLLRSGEIGHRALSPASDYRRAHG